MNAANRAPAAIAAAPAPLPAAPAPGQSGTEPAQRVADRIDELGQVSVL